MPVLEVMSEAEFDECVNKDLLTAVYFFHPVSPKHARLMSAFEAEAAKPENANVQFITFNKNERVPPSIYKKLHAFEDWGELPDLSIYKSGTFLARASSLEVKISLGQEIFPYLIGFLQTKVAELRL